MTVLALAAVGVPAATAAVQKKNYSATYQPSQMYLGVPTDVSIYLANDKRSQQSFGSAQLVFQSSTLPDTGSVTVSATGNPQGQGWYTQVSRDTANSTVTVLVTSQSGVGIAPGDTLTVTATQLTATASPALAVTTEVKQANNFSGTGNDFLSLTSNPLQIPVAPLTLSFTTQPPALTTPNTPFCPPVTVSATEGVGGQGVGGVEVDLYGSDAAGLYLGDTPITSTGSASPSYATAETDSNGVATFGECSSPPAGNALVAKQLGTSMQLTAQLPDASASTTSSLFSVFQTVTHCTTGSCSAQAPASSTGTTGGATTSSSSGSSSYLLGASFGQNESLSCTNLVSTAPADPLSVLSVGGSSGLVGYVTLVFPKSIVNAIPNNGTPLMPVCAGADKPFLTLQSTSPASANYPYQGLLYDCTDSTYVKKAGNYSVQMCVYSRAKLAGASEQVVIQVIGLSDPMFW